MFSPLLSGFTHITPDTPLSKIDLNWTEVELPEGMRTKHVHRLHPYMGKFVPQMVEIFLRKFNPRKVCDPFCGSGTTLVESNALGIPSVGADISAFNCLLSRVKTQKYNITKLEVELKKTLYETRKRNDNPAINPKTDSAYLAQWFHPNALRELLIYREFLEGNRYADAMKVILSRAARSSRLTTHFDLDFPKKPQTTPYFCHKHRRECKPTSNALEFLSRYTHDTIKRIREFSTMRTSASVEVICGDSRKINFPKIGAIITSPPYLGLINYHEQHRYAYELLGLDSKDDLEIGAARKGKSKPAREKYFGDMTMVFENVRSAIDSGGVAVVVVHDKDNIYEEIAEDSGYHVDARIERIVDRRTGRRSKEFLEEVFIWRPD
ncbi:class I SAM-dependent methyltransferase [Candidatus Micrarchaeota archaeon]|nr:class I SAM-dependent methyltransferase [Candidatus Micrarchaeota archaeon]